MKSNKSPGNDGFPVEFNKTFRSGLVQPFLNSTKTAKLNNELSSSQKQVTIRLIEKRTKKNASCEIGDQSNYLILILN